MCLQLSQILHHLKRYTTVDTSPICKFSQDDEEDDGIRLKKQRYDGGDK